MWASEVASIVGGELVGPDVECDGASNDSRTTRPGQLFVPLIADRDGHDFIDAAFSAGATATLSSRGPASGSTVVVPDTAAALSALAMGVRGRLPERVVGITGSVGKTSTKDLVTAVLNQGLRTHASERSFNNEIGVPLTLLGAPEESEAVVVEMGARFPGNIAELCRIARPTIGVVTTVGPAHVEFFGSIEGVAATKRELVEALPPSGTAVLNADVALVRAMAMNTRARILSFGDLGEVRARAVTVDDDLVPRFRLETPWGRTEVRLAARGAHNVANALAAAAVALTCGLPLDHVADGLACATLSPQRMDLRRLRSGAVVLDDTYNANPLSMEAALHALTGTLADRRRAVLGTMAELGTEGAMAHAQIGRLCGELGIVAVAVAEPGYGVATVADVAGAVEWLGPLTVGDAVLVKGSRVAGLERVVAALLASD